MLDYAEWVQRAVEFTEGLRQLPGEMLIEVKVAPPLSKAKCTRLAKACSLPIPEPLRRFWTTASARCLATYNWTPPDSLQPQLKVAFPEWSLQHVSGGAEFEPADQMPSWIETGRDFSETFGDEFPKDARFYEHSLPLVPVGNGDFAGLYVKDSVEFPPVVYLCHEGYGGCRIIARSFDEFLIAWEQLGYIGMNFLPSFCHPRTGLIDPCAFPERTAAVLALLRGEVRPELLVPALKSKEREWLLATGAEEMIRMLAQAGLLGKRKLFLFNCACCRRMFPQMGNWSRQAIELAERYADGLASEAELQAVRDSFMEQVLGKSSPDRPFDGMIEYLLGDHSKQRRAGMSSDDLDRILKSLNQARAFSQAEGFLDQAAMSTLDNFEMVHSLIAQHLDEPELSREEAAHADLLRHIFGNPFHLTESSEISQTKIVRFAKRLYNGEPCSVELQIALRDAGHEELAEHFLRPDHPKGCWALDSILGK